MCHGSKMALPALTLIFAAQEFGVGVERIGVALSAYILGMAVVSVPSGMLGDRLGPSRVLAAFFWVLGLGALSCSLATSFPRSTARTLRTTSGGRLLLSQSW